MMKAEGQTGLQGYVEAAFWELEGLVGYSSKRLGHLVLMGAEVRASGTFMRYGSPGRKGPWWCQELAAIVF